MLSLAGATVRPLRLLILRAFGSEPALGNSNAESEQSLLRGSLATLAVQVVGAALGLGVHVALTWMLNSEVEYGLYLVGMSTVMLFSVPVIAGWDTALMRYLPTFDERKASLAISDHAIDGDTALATERQRRISSAALLTRFAAAQLTRNSLIAFGIGAVLALGLYVAGFGFARWTPITVICVIVSVPMLAWSMVRQGALRGRHRGAASTIPESIIRPALTVVVTAIVVVLGVKASGDVVLISQVVAGAIALWLGSQMLPDWLRAKLVPTWTSSSERLLADLSEPNDSGAGTHSETSVHDWSQLARASVITGIATVVTVRIDEWLLGLMIGPATAGLYGPASRFAGLVVFGLNAVNPVLGPLLADHRDDRQQCQRLAKRGARLTALVSSPLALVCLIWPELLLSVLPEAYSESANMLRILAFAQWINTLAGSVGTLLAMTGYHRHLAVILVAAALLDVVLCLALIPWLGAMGAAIATAATIICWNVAAWMTVRVKLGIDASAL